MLFQKGNRKLPKDIAIFNLPHLVTCPGATADCKRYCYARKAENLYKGVLPYRFKNFAISQENGFANEVCKELAKMKNIRAVRIHESGDFYNQKYVNAWTKVAKTFPHLQFTFYTKSFHLFDFSKIRALPNVTAFASVDPTTPKEVLAEAEGWEKATVIGKNSPALAGFFTCPGSCKSCSHCYTVKAGSVAFHRH